MDMYDIGLSALFGGLGVYLLICAIRTYKHLVCKDRLWNAGRVLFVACGVMTVGLFVASGFQSIIRTACMLLCIVSFFLNREGVGDEGIVQMGTITPWERLEAYDYMQKGNRFYVFFHVKNPKRNTLNEVVIPFDAKDQEEVTAYLKKTVGKKHKRIRKMER